MRYKSPIRIAALLGLFLLAVSPALAQQKIGFVNSQEVLFASEEGKALIVEWQSFYNAKAKDLETQNSELQRLQQDYAQNQLTMNPEVLTQKQDELEEKATRLKRAQEDLQREADKRRNKIILDLSLKMRDLLQEYGQANGYAAIFLRDPQQQIFVKNEIDLTQEILRLYNERNPLASSNSGGGK